MEHLPKWKKMGKSFGNWRETWEIQKDEEDRKKTFRAFIRCISSLRFYGRGSTGGSVLGLGMARHGFGSRYGEI